MRTPTILHVAEVCGPEPIGPILIASDGRALVALDFGMPEERFAGLLRRRFGAVVLTQAADPQGFSSAVRTYLGGDVTALDDLPINGGGTEFQRTVWAALRTIPAGQTRSYKQIAAQIGQPGATQAVGAANGANPISLAVPCHRVIGTNGTMTGYGGGVARKEWLLAHERAAAVSVHPS